MATSPPPQGASYSGTLTDTSRWRDFRARADDIFICTPPKCGTTWTQAICTMLVFGEAEHGRQPGRLSPWVDATFAPIEQYLAEIDAQTHRRFIKTHTPLDGIPYDERCTYLVILRDPRDAFLSGLNHRANLTDPRLAENFPQTFHDWLTGPCEPRAWDHQVLDSVVHFFRTYWDARDLPNVHLFHYGDMKRDLEVAVRSMARALGYEYDDARLAEFARAASFENMQRNAQQFAPESGSGLWKRETDFFANGTSGRWRGVLSATELAAFDERLAELLPPGEAAWLVNGGPLS